MRISSISIRNFRGLKDIEIPLACTTVLIGENNAGKSSVLDCISLTLGRRWGQRGTGFSEYDLTIDGDTASDSPRQTTDAEPSPATGDTKADEGPPEASIELLFAEQTVGEWPEEITSGLFGILQTNPLTELNFITLRVTYRFHLLEKAYEPGWAFIPAVLQVRAGLLPVGPARCLRGILIALAVLGPPPQGS